MKEFREAELRHVEDKPYRQGTEKCKALGELVSEASRSTEGLE